MTVYFDRELDHQLTETRKLVKERPAAVIRMAIRAGLPILAERFKVKEEKANPESKHPSA